MDYPMTLQLPGQSAAGEAEQALIEAAQADINAFEGLYWRYADRVYRYMRTRVTNDEDAADLTQQVFLQALKSLPGYRFRGVPFAAWLFRIARHMVTDRHRRSKETISWELVPEVMHESSEQDPETIVLYQETSEQLRKLIGKLDPAKRELLALRFAARLNTAEIAETVGKSQASVKKQLSRIIHTLQIETQGGLS